MRCKYCGWINPDGSKKCERCSSPLDITSFSNNESSNEYSQEESSNLRSTVREKQDGLSPHGNSYHSTERVHTSIICRKCGYALSSFMNICPQCGTPRSQESTDFKRNKNKTSCPKCGTELTIEARFCPICGLKLHNSPTVNSWDNPQDNFFCTLRPIPWGREQAQYENITYSGERIILNRENTDPNNQTITSHEQAVLTYDGKDWYIEDMSEQHSTMLRISRKTKLQSGDVIALGNRLFEFKD